MSGNTKSRIMLAVIAAMSLMAASPAYADKPYDILPDYITDPLNELQESMDELQEIADSLFSQAVGLAAGKKDKVDYSSLKDDLTFTETRRDMELMAGRHYRTVTVDQYKYQGSGKYDWEEYPYLYHLRDRDRNIIITQAVKEPHGKKNIFTGKEEVYVPVSTGNKYSEEAEALCSVGQAYDYYAKHYNWIGPDGKNKARTCVVTKVEQMEKGVDFSDGTWAYYDGSEGFIYIGQYSDAADDPVTMMHEYTHLVLSAKGIKTSSKEQCAVEEGYADVMGVCAFSSGWVFKTEDGDRYLDGSGNTIYDVSEFMEQEQKPSAKLELVDLEHKGATVLGHAAYLMNTREILDVLTGKASARERLSKAQIALLFYTSMDYLGTAPDFSSAGDAIMKAAYSLNGEQGELSLEQVDRVREALERCEIKNDWKPEEIPAELPENRTDSQVTKEDEETPGGIYAPFLDLLDTEAVFMQKTEELSSAYGIISTELLKKTESRTAEELSGILNVFVYDFDHDGNKELLVNRFEAVSGKLFLHLEIYEDSEKKAVLQDKKKLEVPWLTEDMYKYISSAGGFLYEDSGGECHIGLETYEAFDGNMITTALYHYDGQHFVFDRAACYQWCGDGEIYVSEADEEGNHGMILDGTIRNGKYRSPAWHTLEHYRFDSNDREHFISVSRQVCIDLYKDNLRAAGLRADADLRLQEDLQPSDPFTFDGTDDNAIFRQTLQDVYGKTRGFTALWRIASWTPSSSGMLQLEREDFQDRLR